VSRRASVVIIGGGVTGASIAFHLTVAGLRDVILLERRALASGGTGRSVGIVRQLYPTAETSRMVVRSLGVFQRFREAVGGESGYVACGALIGVSVAMRAKLEATVRLQRAVGVRAEVLEPGDLARVEPRIDPGTLGAVLYEPDSGYGDPTAVTSGYANAARRNGASIEQGVEVVAIRHSASHVTGVETAAGEHIEAPIVVNAAGLWSPAVARLAHIELPIVVGRHPVFVVERDASFGRPHLVYLDLAGGSYARPETGGLTLTGSLTDDEKQHPMEPELLGTDVGLDEAAQVLERTARAIPRLAEARYRRGWAGAFDITPDWMPILDESPLRGFWIAAGMSGHGFKLSPVVGEMMAALITGAQAPVDPTPFAFGRFGAKGSGGTFVASYLG
jgi:sarcosine oxidase subunit beta